MLMSRVSMSENHMTYGVSDGYNGLNCFLHKVGQEYCDVNAVGQQSQQ
jgi:hypothetical protein